MRAHRRARIITASKLEELRSATRGARPRRSARQETGPIPMPWPAQLNHNKLTGISLTARYTVGARDHDLISPDQLRSTAARLLQPIVSRMQVVPRGVTAVGRAFGGDGAESGQQPPGAIGPPSRQARPMAMKSVDRSRKPGRAPGMRRGETAKTERRAVRRVDEIVSDELGWLFREQPLPDYGVDAQAELVAEDELVTGRLLGLQIKGGDSRFVRVKGGQGWVFRDSNDHLAYWLGHSLPVLVVIVDPDGNAFWQAVTTSTIREAKRASPSRSRAASPWTSARVTSCSSSPAGARAFSSLCRGITRCCRQTR
jgi:hypothetical protein